MFHVSFLCFNSLKIRRFKRWNIGVQCFIFGLNVSFFIYHTPFQKNTHGEKSNPNGSDLKPQWERNQTPMGETPLKHWNQKWNIECQCFISWKYWLSMHCVMKMKHGTKKRLKVNIMYAYVRARKERVLTSRQRVLTWGRRVPEAADKIAVYRVKVFLFELF